MTDVLSEVMIPRTCLKKLSLKGDGEGARVSLSEARLSRFWLFFVLFCFT